MFAIILITFIGVTLSVPIFTSVIARDIDRSVSPIEEYFLGGRSLTWPLIAGSLLLTDLSIEQLIGLNGASFKERSVIGVAWEVSAVLALIMTALFFLPRYLESGVKTTPASLERRFDPMTRLLVSGIFLLAHITVLLPVILYTGASVLQGIFELQYPLWWIIVSLGLLGSWYAVFGGLKAVVVSDTLYATGLFAVGLSIPLLALSTLGDGSISAGLSILIFESATPLTALPPNLLSPLARVSSGGGVGAVPWDMLLTGVIFVQIFYWSTNQVIVQRALGARSLAEGQKGVLFASLMKLIGPAMFCLPGVIALRMLGELSVLLDPQALSEALIAHEGSSAPLVREAILLGQNILDSGASRLSLETALQLRPLDLSYHEQVYSAVVRRVLPDWSQGFFAAVLVGAIVSSFNSALNSASTLFCLDFYKEYLRRRSSMSADAQERQLVTAGRIFGVLLACIAMTLAHSLAQMESILNYLQTVAGLYSAPIVSVFIIGMLNHRAPAGAAKLALLIGSLLYSALMLASIDNIHWLHVYMICVVITGGVLLLGARLYPKSDEEIELSSARPIPTIDLTPWPHARTASMSICLVIIMLYIGLEVL